MPAPITATSMIPTPASCSAWALNLEIIGTPNPGIDIQALVARAPQTPEEIPLALLDIGPRTKPAAGKRGGRRKAPARGKAGKKKAAKKTARKTAKRRR